MQGSLGFFTTYNKARLYEASATLNNEKDFAQLVCDNTDFNVNT